MYMNISIWNVKVFSKLQLSQWKQLLRETKSKQNQLSNQTTGRVYTTQTNEYKNNCNFFHQLRWPQTLSQTHSHPYIHPFQKCPVHWILPSLNGLIPLWVWKPFVHWSLFLCWHLPPIGCWQVSFAYRAQEGGSSDAGSSCSVPGNCGSDAWKGKWKLTAARDEQARMMQLKLRYCR